MEELRRCGDEPCAVGFVPSDRILLPPVDREGMRRKASPCVECELRLRGGMQEWVSYRFRRSQVSIGPLARQGKIRRLPFKIC